MKKAALEEEKFEHQPTEYRTKLEELKGIKTKLHEAFKNVKVQEEKQTETRLKNSFKENVKSLLKIGALPFSLKAKKVHSTGDFYGRFHPSKSKKGIKRSE
jgi:hypothetical protein